MPKLDFDWNDYFTIEEIKIITIQLSVLHSFFCIKEVYFTSELSIGVGMQNGLREAVAR